MHLKIKRILDDGKTYEFELINDQDEAVGIIVIRTTSVKGIKDIKDSQVYYEIYPEFRRVGHGNRILQLGLVKAKSLGLNEVIIAVMDDNVPAVKIIESNGGVFLDRTPVGIDNKMMSKYKFTL
jgi:predicted acetyltransferase